mmetsp:Transcript_22164/g.52704  ORF Transcript_22164/g.52704 Transcript_22164/m.52704 type:complete len:126 (+) Transcript_22164:54-431(+)|eukprot:CAMPEP_0181452396 /NCGR_PEP_ID=MMETSP1110-20121109/29185_1 /TAXON_ID=174948 /ORGANISM="Symbiodinium sp., Strain CCMP421" /LENGTH=125 /DNA_ID=CAMNT_0023576677 /DNA_START=25 /DNA_END=402 /DNA_ORIENTATION=-
MGSDCVKAPKEPMSEEKVAEIEKWFAAKWRGTPRTTARQGDWIIALEGHDSGDDGLFTWGLFHVPTWRSGEDALVTTHFTDLSHVGVRGPGHGLKFGGPGEVLKVDGESMSEVVEKIDLAKLLPK